MRCLPSVGNKELWQQEEKPSWERKYGGWRYLPLVGDKGYRLSHEKPPGRVVRVSLCLALVGKGKYR